jgi:transposase
MRPRGSAEVLEARRRHALELLSEGHSLNAVARWLRCAASSVMRWRNEVKRRGERAFHVGASPGRPPKLTKRQQQQLIRLLLQGSLAHGYRTDLWTTARVAEVILRHFGVRYHPDHVGRLLHSLHWTPQKPQRRALQRTEAAIAKWKRDEWPRVKKTPRGWAPISSS